MAKKKSITEVVEPEPMAAPAASNYTVLARRYRPQQFSDLVGQEAVAQALSNALTSGRVAHAYIFTGTRGVGKTSAARILAKALNCEKGPSPTPCDQCENCKAIISGDGQDVLEIDGASNNGVENIRELRQNVQFRPTRSRFKIYIIDEVHMLSSGAFNALLKTLEEPPPHIKFIFATTETQKVPITVLSRCQRFDFGGIGMERIHTRLKEIVAAEGKQADDEALELVARRAGGSMRDAQSLLDQLLSFSGAQLTVETINQLLGTAHEERVTALADAVLSKDVKRALQVLNDVLNQGQQLGELLDQLIEYWRDLMVVNCAGLEGQSVSVSSARRDILKQHASKTGLDTILAGMDILVTAKSRLRFSGHGRTLLEMALVRLGQLDELLSITQIAQLLNREGAMPAAIARSPVAAPRQQIIVPGSEKKKLTDDNPIPAQSIPLQEENLDLIWQQVLEQCGFAIQADLRKVGARAISGPNTLVLRVSRRYNTQAGAFLDPARSAKVEESLRRITGASCTIRIEWFDEPKTVEMTAPGSKNSTAVAMGQQRQLRSELAQLPFVKQASEVLGAQIIRADEGFGAAKQASSDSESEATSEDE